MPQLSDGFGFDLSDAFARDVEDPADFLERPGIAGADAEAQADDLGFAFAERREDALDFAVPEELVRRTGGRRAGAILDEILEERIVFFPHWSRQGDRVLHYFQNFAD